MHVHNSDDDEASFRLMVFRRGELDDAATEAMRGQLTCAECMAGLEAELALDRLLADAAAAWSAPPELERAARELLGPEATPPHPAIPAAPPGVPDPPRLPGSPDPSDLRSGGSLTRERDCRR